MINAVNQLHQIVEYRPITPGHVTQIDHEVKKKPFLKPTASSLQKYERNVRKHKPTPAGKYRQAVTRANGMKALREHRSHVGIPVAV